MNEDIPSRHDARAPQPVALVTGGGRGIGRAIAMRLAADGFIVAINWHRNEEAAIATAAEIRARGGSATTHQASVADEVDIDRLTAQVLERHQRVDVLVNNGGVASRGRSVAETDLGELQHILATHAIGPFLLSQRLLPQMRQLGRGDIIMISSTASSDITPGCAPYSMAKTAVEALAKTIAMEESQHGIRANIVAPGLVATEMGDRLIRALTGDAVQTAAGWGEHGAFGRTCRPDDVAAAVSFLVSADGEYINGHRMVVDGACASPYTAVRATPSPEPRSAVLR